MILKEITLRAEEIHNWHLVFCSSEAFFSFISWRVLKREFTSKWKLKLSIQEIFFDLFFRNVFRNIFWNSMSSKIVDIFSQFLCSYQMNYISACELLSE